MKKQEQTTEDKIKEFCSGLDEAAENFLQQGWAPEIVGLALLRTACGVLSGEFGTKGTKGILATAIRRIDEEGIEGATDLGIFLNARH